MVSVGQSAGLACRADPSRGALSPRARSTVGHRLFNPNAIYRLSYHAGQEDHDDSPRKTLTVQADGSGLLLLHGQGADAAAAPEKDHWIMSIPMLPQLDADREFLRFAWCSVGQ